MGIQVICFSLSAFNIYSLFLIIIKLINMCLGVFHLRFVLFRTLCVSWTWVAISFPILGKFSAINSSSIFSWPFFLSSSGTSMIQMLGHLTVPEVLEVVLISFHSFFLSVSFISTILSSTSLILSSTSVILLLVHSRVLLISVIALFIIH